MPLFAKAFSSAAASPPAARCWPRPSHVSSPGRDGDFENSIQKGALAPSMLCGGCC